MISTCCCLSKRHDIDKADNLNFRVLIFPERKKQKLVKKTKERKKEAVQKLSSSSSEGRFEVMTMTREKKSVSNV